MGLRFALFAIFLSSIWVLGLSLNLGAQRISETTPGLTTGEGSDAHGRAKSDQNSTLDAPSGLHLSEGDKAHSGSPPTFPHLVFALLSGLAITAARVRIKFRRFVGLGVFTNWYSVLFLLIGTILCGLPQTSINVIASSVAPTAAPWILDAFGVVLTVLLGTQIGGLKTTAGGGTLPAPVGQGGLNVVLAVIEDGVRDRILTRMQVVMVEDARRYKWQAIVHAAQRTVQEEIAIGRVSREHGDAAIKAVVALRSSREGQGDFDRKYEALIGLLSCCPLSRLRTALAAAPGEL